jgi:DNA-binding NtrC family response regulator
MSKGQGNTVYASAIEAYRRALLEHALTRSRGNRTHAARALGLQRTYFGRLLRARGITYAPAVKAAR